MGSKSEMFTDLKSFKLGCAVWLHNLLKGHFNLLGASKIIKLYIEFRIQKKMAKSSKS